MTTDGGDGPVRVDDVGVDDARTVREDARAWGCADARTHGEARMCEGVPEKTFLDKE